MIASQEAAHIVPFTVYWNKYITPQVNSQKESRKEAFYARIKKTNHTYSPMKDIPDHDIAAYFHKV
jgi:hypothetical protein